MAFNLSRNLAIEKRSSLVLKVILSALLAGIILSYKLWMPDRLFPIAPVTHLFAAVPSAFNYLLGILLVVLTAIGIFYGSPVVLRLLFAVMLFLLMQDQNRWQPWVYMYFLLLVFYTFRNRSNHSLNYGRIIMIGVYFYSGLQKLNGLFIETSFRSILIDFFGFTDVEWINRLLPLGNIIGAIEIGIALLLYFPATRKTGTWLVVVVHTFVLLYLSPLGLDHNTVVYPWNIAMPILVFLLFYGTIDKMSLAVNDRFSLQLLAAVFAWIMPLLNFFGYWDNYLSFSLYSDREPKYYIAIAGEEIHKIDTTLTKYFANMPGIEGGKLIDASEWSLRELNVPMYPEHRVFKKVAGYFCNRDIRNGYLYFLELEPGSGQQFYRFDCSELGN